MVYHYMYMLITEILRLKGQKLGKNIVHNNIQHDKGLMLRGKMGFRGGT